MSRIKNVIFRASAITLISLFLPAKTLLAHGGSHHASSEQKQKDEQRKIEDSHEEMHSENHKNTQNSSTSQTKNSVNTEKSKNMSATENYKNFNLFPKTSELVFLGLIIGPFLLKLIRKGIHNNNGS